MSTFDRKLFVNYSLALILILAFVETKVYAETQAEYQAREQAALGGNPEHLEQWYNDNPAPSFQQPVGTVSNPSTVDPFSTSAAYDPSDVANPSNPASPYYSGASNSAPVGSVSNPSTVDPFSTSAAYDPSDVANPSNPASPYYSGASDNASPVGTASNPSTEDPFQSSAAYDPNDLADPNNPASPYYTGNKTDETAPAETASSENGETGSGGSTGSGASQGAGEGQCNYPSCISLKQKAETAKTNIKNAAGLNVAPTTAALSAGANSGTAGVPIASAGQATSGGSIGTIEKTYSDYNAIRNQAVTNVRAEAQKELAGYPPAQQPTVKPQIEAKMQHDIKEIETASNAVKQEAINGGADANNYRNSIASYGSHNQQIAGATGSSGSGLTGAGGSTGSSVAGGAGSTGSSLAGGSTGSSLGGGSTGSSLAGGTRAPASSGGFFSSTAGKVVGAVAAGGLAYGIVSAMQDDDEDSGSSGNSSGSHNNNNNHNSNSNNNNTSNNNN